MNVEADQPRRWLLITGGSRGIGAATAVAFAQAGYDIALHYNRSEQEAGEVARQCTSFGARTELFRADLLQPSRGEELARQVLARTPRVDVVIHGAGVSARPALFGKTQPSQFQEHLQINLNAVVELTQGLLPSLVEHKGVLLTVLTSYVLGAPPAKLSPYISAKYALLGLTRSLAVELAPKGVRVNAVAPGVTETAMIDHLPDLFRQQLSQQIPLRRLGVPEDVAKVLLFLASDAAAYMTGTIIPVCGGHAM